MDFMHTVFVDTAGWAHLFDCNQAFHARAVTLYTQFKQQAVPLVTTNYVLAELVALLTSPLRVPRPQIVKIVESIHASPYVHVMHVTKEWDERAWEFFKRHTDKTWSLVDCASFVIMRELGIQEALTSDRHFEQAGFTILLKS